MRSTNLFGGVGFNTLILFSAEYAAEQTAMVRITKNMEHSFLVNLHLRSLGLSLVPAGRLQANRGGNEHSPFYLDMQ